MSKNNYRPMLGKHGKNHNKSKCVFQYDKDMNFIREWESLRDIEKYLFIKHTSISYVCNGKRKTAGKFIWRFKNAII